MTRSALIAALLGSAMLLPAAQARAQVGSSDQTQVQPANPGQAGSPPAPAPSTAPGQSATADAGDVVVTGSRVITNGNNSPVPVTVVTYQQLQTTKPSSLFEGLTQLPSLVSSRGTNANPSINGGIGGGNGAASQLNLRNVGATRNLILFDGHRVPPTLFSGITDMDIIPQNVLQRVDLVTGGVSAVYGSDAVTGVINFITDRKFTGLKAGVQAGISQYDDAPSQDANISFGANIGSRGHIMISYEYRNDAGVDRKTVRQWFQYQSGSGLATAASPSNLVLGARGIGSTFTGQTTIAGVRYSFQPNGALAPQVLGTDIGNPVVRQGGEGVYQDNGLKAAVRGHQFYARADYDVTDTIHFNVFGLGSFKTNSLYANFVDLSGIAVAKNNPYLTAQAAALLPATATQFNVNRTILTYDYRYNPSPETDQIYVGGAFDGKVGKFDWQVYGGYGSSYLKTTVYNNLNREKLAAAVDAVNVGGTIRCSTVAIRPDCVPINLLGGTITTQQLDYITDTTHYNALTTLKDFNAQISGPLFSLPAGDVCAALSGEWREVAFKSSSDHPPDLYANCTGLTRNCTASGAGRTILYANTLPNLARVAQHVKEGAVEVNVPLLRDTMLAQDLSLNGAARYASYDTSGDYWSWKVGIDWKPVSDVKLRGHDLARHPRPQSVRHRVGGLDRVHNLTDTVGGNVAANNIPSYNVPYSALSRSGTFQIFGNNGNLFNKAPPYAPTTALPGGFGGWPIGDDWVGRYFNAGVRVRI